MRRSDSDTNRTTLSQEHWRRLDDRFARLMFFVSLASLCGLACLLHFHEREEYRGILISSLTLSVILWPCYWLEYVLARRTGSPRAKERLWCCLLPPLRLAARDHETGTRVWLPSYGWQTVSRELQERLERAGNTPMMAIALLVLPLIAIEFHYADEIAADPRWAASVAAATTLIWFAFTMEFVVMCSLAERKVDYCLKHWLDLAIILLPLVAFLRALRLGRLLRLQQITRTARMYRMRGVVMRAWRALLVLEFVRRVMHGHPEKRMKRVEELIAQKEQELDELRSEWDRLQAALSESATPPVESSEQAA